MASWAWSTDILAALSRSGHSLTAAEICDAVCINRASAYRVLEKLEADGWIVGEGRPKRYAGGLRLAEVGMPSVRALPARSTLLPVLAELARTLNVATQLVFYVGAGRVFSSDSAQLLGGELLVQPHCVSARAALTASGKILLAFEDDAEVEAVISKGLPQVTANTLTTPTAIREAIAEARCLGFGRVDREFDEDHSGFAVPVFSQPGRTAAAFGVSMLGPWNPKAADELLPTVRQFAARASAMLDSHPRMPVVI